MQGKVEFAEALGATGAVTRVEGGNLEGESCWKSGGGRTRLYSWPRVGLADEARPDAAGGEGGHGAAKPHGVIHRCIFNRPNFIGACCQAKAKAFRRFVDRRRHRLFKAVIADVYCG
jgi:hypothetical protein